MKDTRIQCPCCGMRTWSTDYAGFMRDHDRADGRVCLAAARRIAGSGVIVKVNPTYPATGIVINACATLAEYETMKRLADGARDTTIRYWGPVDCEIGDTLRLTDLTLPTTG